MDLNSTSKFIAEIRKEKHLTQVQLAEILGVSEKTISKWECGKGFPDTGLILPLCEVLGISANELLSGRRLSTEEYKNTAEQNLMELKSKQEQSTKHLLTLEWVIGYISTISALLMIFVASFAVEILAWRIVLIIAAVTIIVVGTVFAVKIERDAGFYECNNCHYKYIPSYKSVVWSMHIGRTRYMKCPKCNKRTWQNKCINDD